MIRQVISHQGDAALAARKPEGRSGRRVQLVRQRFNNTSSVNIDEEMANLLNLQNAYAANARVMSTIKEMLDTLLKM